MFRSLSRCTVSPKFFAAVVMVVSLAVSSAHAQSARKSNRETNANRKARIERQIQETYTHRWEVAGGGGFLRFRSGPYTQRNNEVTFWLDSTYYLNQKLGITGEIRGAYGNGKVLQGNRYASLVGYPQISEYPFMAGPTYRIRTKEKTSIGIFAIGGTAIGKFDGDSKNQTAQSLGFWPSTNARPAFSIGANLDANIFPNLAFRIAPSYLGTTFGGSLQSNLGVNIGLVYRFGRQK